MSDRNLRDELELLQVKVRGFEHELTAEHAPGFLQKRDELRSALATERARLNEVERRGAAADRGFVELSTRVEALTSRLRAIEQQRLGTLPLLILIALGATALTVFTQEMPFAVLGATGAFILGLLFGHRLWASARGDDVQPGAPRTSVLTVPALFSAIIAGILALLWIASELSAG